MFEGKRVVWQSDGARSHKIIIDGNDWTPYITNINIDANRDSRTMCRIEFACSVDYQSNSLTNEQMVADLTQLREDLEEDPEESP